MAGVDTNWIPVDCFFAFGVSEGDLKQMLPQGVVMENGFVCPADGKWDNNDLASIFTGLLGLMQKQIDKAPTSPEFFECLKTAFLCDFFNDRISFDIRRGSGTLSSSAPTVGGEYCAPAWYFGGQDAFTSLGTNWIYEVDDDDQGYGGFNYVNSIAGGLVAHTVPQTSGPNVSGVLLVMYIRKDCD